MPTIPIHISRPTSTPTSNPLPQLLHTPSGLALVELQGTIHFPARTPSEQGASTPSATEVGKLVFPLHNPDLLGADDTKWMKRVYLYIGKNQRMTGEVKKLGKPFAVIRRREGRGGEDVDMGGVGEEEGVGGGVGTGEELEIVEIVRYKIMFSSRPEPVGGEIV